MSIRSDKHVYMTESEKKEGALTHLRASHAALLAAAKEVIDACEDPDSASGDVSRSIGGLKAAIAAAEESAP
jgi:hypothetical protein